jgi:hypothetical protein
MTVSAPRRKNSVIWMGDAGTKSPNGPQYFVVRSDQSCAGGETADISIPSPGAKVSRLARMII